jgi:aromatic-L-amino-acid decarboxylase
LLPGLTNDEFRRLAHETVDWMADYLAGVSDLPVLPACRPGEFAAGLPLHAPECGEPMEAVLSDFRNRVPGALTNWNHPRFLAYFAISGSEPGILGEMLAAALNVNGMLWQSCPAVTELEQVTLDWLRQWLGLPAGLFGILYDTASTSTLHAIVAARELVAPESRQTGNAGLLTLYCSELAHSSVDKGAFTAGVGRRNVRKIAVDSEFRMKPDALASAVEQDLRSGLTPFCVVATVGTTSVASIDPVRECAAISRQHGMWLHVDAAYGGSAAVADEMRHVLDAADQADSLVVNPHKWLLTPVDCSAFFTTRPESLRQAFSLVPSYLQTNQDDRAVNLMDYSFILGRRFRALKLWFVMRYYGRQGIAAILRRHIADAQEFRRWVEADDRFEVAAPVLFSLVCFRLKGGDELNRRLVDDLNRTGVAFLAGTMLNGRFVIRLAVGHHRTTRQDLRVVWDKIRELVPAL